MSVPNLLQGCSLLEMTRRPSEPGSVFGNEVKGTMARIAVQSEIQLYLREINQIALLTPIEERIKDLHESMNARQHAHAPYLPPPLCSCCPLLPPAAPRAAPGWRRRLSMARLPPMRGDPAHPS